MADLIAFFAEEPFYRSLGVAGFLLYVVTYAGLSLRWMHSDSIGYFVTNTTAATFVLISLSHDFNMASALIQVFWIGLGVIGISLRLHQRWS